jgi:hypothetical protein
VHRLSDVLPFLEPGELLEGKLRHEVFQKFWEKARPDAFAMPF